MVAICYEVRRTIYTNTSTYIHTYIHAYIQKALGGWQVWTMLAIHDEVTHTQYTNYIH